MHHRQITLLSFYNTIFHAFSRTAFWANSHEASYGKLRPLLLPVTATAEKNHEASYDKLRPHDSITILN